MSDNGDEPKTWEDIYPDTMRNVVVSEIEDQLFALEQMSKRDISLTCFQKVYESIEGFMLEFKKLHSAFRRVVYENDLSQHKKFVEDSKATCQWQINVWNRLDKTKPAKSGQGVAPQQQAHGLSAAGQSSIVLDTLHNLDLTLQKHNDEYGTSVNLSKPHFKGGANSFLAFEAYKKSFNTWTRNIKDTVRKFQLLRDTLSGPAYKQISEMDVVEENYLLAWQRLETVYLKPEECKGLLIDKINNFQFNVNIDKMDENFNNFCLLIDKLNKSYNIDLLNVGAGVDQYLAHLTFKKLPINLRNILLMLCDSHYPTFVELKNKIPIAIDRIRKTENMGENYNCNTISSGNSKGSNFSDNSKKFCILCEKDTHYSSNCLKYSTIHDRINRLKDTKRCTYCSKKSHTDKNECDKLICKHCHKSGHISILCFDKVNDLSCNKSSNESEDTANDSDV